MLDPLILPLALLFALPQSSGDDAPPAADASAILDAARAALGDPARVDAMGGLRLRGEASWAGGPGGGTFVEEHGGLRRTKQTSVFEGFGQFEQGAEEAVLWERSPMGLKVRDGWDASEVARRFGRAQHVAWREMYSSATLAGEVSHRGRPCLRVELAPRLLYPGAPGVELPESGRADVWWIDAETHHTLRVESRAVGVDDAPTSVEAELDDWRAEDGVLFPHHVEVKVSGFTVVLRYTAFELGVEFEEGHFDAPADVLQAAAKHASEAGKRDAKAIELVELEARHVASIRVQCPQAQMQRTFAVILPEAMQHVISGGGTIAGPPLVRYHTWGDPIDIEAAMPVSEPTKPAGRVKAETLPAGQAAVAWHVGPYDGLGATHEKLQAWLEARGLERRAAPWEEYWTDPGMEPDPKKWRTKLVYPVREKPEEGGD